MIRRQEHRPLAGPHFGIEEAKQLTEVPVQAHQGVARLDRMRPPIVTDGIGRREADAQQVGRRILAELHAKHRRLCRLANDGIAERRSIDLRVVRRGYRRATTGHRLRQGALAGAVVVQVLPWAVIAQANVCGLRPGAIPTLAEERIDRALLVELRQPHRCLLDPLTVADQIASCHFEPCGQVRIPPRHQDRRTVLPANARDLAAGDVRFHRSRQGRHQQAPGTSVATLRQIRQCRRWLTNAVDHLLQVAVPPVVLDDAVQAGGRTRPDRRMAGTGFGARMFVGAVRERHAGIGKTPEATIFGIERLAQCVHPRRQLVNGTQHHEPRALLRNRRGCADHRRTNEGNQGRRNAHHVDSILAARSIVRQGRRPR